MSKTCSNCGRVSSGKVVRGLCPPCRLFEDRHGRPRTTADMIRRKGDPRPFCTNCKQARVTRHRFLCGACYQYQKRTGKQRPSHLWRESCYVCRRPRVTGFVRGRCRVCHGYLQRYGRDRDPKRIVRLYPMGWCDCGNPAVRADDEMRYCADCWQIEQQMPNTVSFHGRDA
jgi:hypothetical protein